VEEKTKSLCSDQKFSVFVQALISLYTLPLYILEEEKTAARLKSKEKKQLEEGMEEKLLSDRCSFIR
jgi:hypothetical protein